MMSSPHCSCQSILVPLANKLVLEIRIITKTKYFELSSYYSDDDGCANHSCSYDGCANHANDCFL